MRQAVFRAVEQGFSLLRQANQGLSVAVDGYERVYGELDHFLTEDRVLRAELPVGRVLTRYARIGDSVGRSPAWPRLDGWAGPSPPPHLPHLLGSRYARRLPTYLGDQK